MFECARGGEAGVNWRNYGYMRPDNTEVTQHNDVKIPGKIISHLSGDRSLFVSFINNVGHLGSARVTRGVTRFVITGFQLVWFLTLLNCLLPCFE